MYVHLEIDSRSSKSIVINDCWTIEPRDFKINLDRRDYKY